MKSKYLLMIAFVLLVSACAPRSPSNPADRFAGTWSGTMNFTDDANRKEEIIVSIPAGCDEGSVCGSIDNTTVGCVWEMTL